MSTTARIQHKGQVTIPTRVRKQAGLDKGDLVEFSFQRGKIILTPQVVIDRSKFPDANDEYTADQRRIIDARLKSAEKTPLHGPFKDGQEIAAYLKTFKAQREAKPNLQKPR
jgi:AbrB family looped-hinge helix DNA binding protein